MKIWLICILTVMFLYSCTSKKQDHTHANIQVHFSPPKVTVLADLSDNLKPRIIYLDTAPKPRSIDVPSHVGGSYNIITDKGELKKINLEPPVVKPLPCLNDAKGILVKDSAGHAFVLGSGGMSYFTNYTTDNGLPMDAIYCSYMDRSGNLWFGTLGGGVSRFDGKTFTTFTTDQGLAFNGLGCIFEDRTGNLWFGTYGSGISRYDGKTFTTFSTKQGLANNSVYSIAEDRNGNLWFGTDGGGVSCYNGKTFSNFTTKDGLANNFVLWITEDKTGKLWFGTNGGGVSRYDGKKFTTLSTSNGLANNQVYCIREDKTGKLWFGTNSGASRFDGNMENDPETATPDSTKLNSLFTNYSTKQGLPDNGVRSIGKDKEGNLWFGNNGGGVSCYNGETFVTYTTTEGLANNLITSITADKAGNLWFGTRSHGLSRYNGKTVVTFNSAQGLADNVVFSIGEDKSGNLWMGTDFGVSRYDGNSFTTFTNHQGLSRNVVWCFYEDKSGKKWLGTDDGLSLYDGKAFVTYSPLQGLADNVVWSIAEDKAGRLWFGTRQGGVSCYDENVNVNVNEANTVQSSKRQSRATFTNYAAAQGFTNDGIMCIKPDKAGNLWFASLGSGVIRYDGKSFERFNTAQGLADNQVFAITEDKTGNLWFATASGLSVMRGNVARKLSSSQSAPGSQSVSSVEGGTFFFKTFTKADGLSDNMVTQVLQMPDGRMAVGTNQGITMFRPSEDLSKLNELAIFNTNTGYPIKDINSGQNCMLLDKKGIIWAGTGNEKAALVRFDPSGINTEMNPPMLIIKGVKVNEFSICWEDLSEKLKTKSVKLSPFDSITIPAYIVEEVNTFGKRLSDNERDSMRYRFRGLAFDSIRRFYPVPENLVLPYRNNHITIDFNAIETGKPEMVNYQYILEGYDKDWSPVSKKSNATFGNIYEGDYTFKVKAQGPNGVWSEPVSYTFTVLPPWYRTWWAYGLYVLLFLVALRLFIDWRQRNLRLENEKLDKIIQIKIKELNQSLVQKELLLGEVHHRVKNNLQIICSLLEINASKINDENAKNVLVESQSRIMSMSIIHQGLYKNDRFDSIDFRSFAFELFAQLAHIYADQSGEIQLINELPSQFFVLDVALPLGLILNELITNSIKHAGKITDSLEITISLSQKDKYTLLRYSDNGRGLPEGININTQKSLGLFLITKLTKQLGGYVSYDNERGSTFNIHFIAV